MSVFAKRLKAARLAAKISQERLGVLAGIDEMSASARMNQYERGKHAPDYTMVHRLSTVLDVPEAYFYAAADDEATLLLKFHRLTAPQRAVALALLSEL
ncbi:helix-turn-helix transcriptional regulator [Hydrogenophaga sp. BPS33]|nr:helix-turn-helix transcriptional regulator [Hydrogenophaga sp. BPS33]